MYTYVLCSVTGTLKVLILTYIDEIFIALAFFLLNLNPSTKKEYAIKKVLGNVNSYSS